MLIYEQERSSQIATGLAAAGDFHLSQDQAQALVAAQVEVIGAQWRPLCEEAGLGEVDRARFWGRQFLNPMAFYRLEGAGAALAERAAAIRASV
jgi:serine/threonine-protein kinase HipA